MISRVVEISIAGGAEEMVRPYSLVLFSLCFSFSVFVIILYLFLGTKSLLQGKL